jgi:vancomycin resistance protein YoaR
MPWDYEPEFLAFQDMYDVHILLGGYKTVLLDPLPGEEYNVSICSRYLRGMVIQPGEVFSINDKVGPYNKERGFMEGPTYSGTTLIKSTGGGVCKVATTLYNASMLGNLSIIERHNHTMPVSYVEYGQDASVAFDYKDLKLVNNRAYPILIWAEGIEDTLYIGIYGRDTPPIVEWKHETSGVRVPFTIYKKNILLKPGEIKEVVKGMEGRTVRSWVHITYKDGTEEIKYVGISIYEPLPCIVEIGG